MEQVTPAWGQRCLGCKLRSWLACPAQSDVRHLPPGGLATAAAGRLGVHATQSGACLADFAWLLASCQGVDFEYVHLCCVCLPVSCVCCTLIMPASSCASCLSCDALPYGPGMWELDVSSMVSATYLRSHLH